MASRSRIKRVCLLAALACAPFIANKIWPAHSHATGHVPPVPSVGPVQTGITADPPDSFAASPSRASPDAGSLPEPADDSTPVNYAMDRHHIRIHVNADGTAVVEREVDVTPFDEFGVQMLAQQSEAYSTHLDSLEILGAWTQRPDGERIDVLPDAIQDVDEYAGLEGVYSDKKKRVVVFPNVEPGSRLHFHTRLRVHKTLFPGHFMYGIGLTPDTIHRDFMIELTHDDGIDVHIETRDLLNDSVVGQDGKVKVHRYRLQQDTALPYEETSVAWSDLFPSFMVTTMDSIGELGKQYQARAQAAEMPNEEIIALANAITLGIDDPYDQVKALYEWVTREIRYVGIYLGDATVVPNMASDVLRNRYGDCKDHNTILISLLKAKGFDAQGALINNSNSYEMPQIGAMGTLNHVITYVPQWDLFLDSTNALTPFAVLPDTETDKPALLVRDGRVVRTPKETPADNMVRSEVKLFIHDDGVIHGNSHSEAFGPLSIGPRYALANLFGANRQDLIRRMLAENNHPGTGDIQMSGLRELGNPLSFDFTFELEPITNFPGQGAFNLPEGLSANPLSKLAVDFSKVKRSTLRFPAPCTSADFRETFRITLESGTVFTHVPDDVVFEDGGLVYTAHYERSERDMVATRHLVIDLPSNVCQPDQMVRLGRMMDVIKRDLRSQIFYQSI